MDLSLLAPSDLMPLPEPANLLFRLLLFHYPDASRPCFAGQLSKSVVVY